MTLVPDALVGGESGPECPHPAEPPNALTPASSLLKRQTGEQRVSIIYAGASSYKESPQTGPQRLSHRFLSCQHCDHPPLADMHMLPKTIQEELLGSLELHASPPPAQPWAWELIDNPPSPAPLIHTQ